MISIKRILFEKLRAIDDDRDFIIGVISNAETDENFRKIIDYIDNGEDVTVENLIALSVLLDSPGYTEAEYLRDWMTNEHD